MEEEQHIQGYYFKILPRNANLMLVDYEKTITTWFKDAVLARVKLLSPGAVPPLMAATLEAHFKFNIRDPSYLQETKPSSASPQVSSRKFAVPKTKRP